MVPVHVDYEKIEATKQDFPTFTFALTHWIEFDHHYSYR